MRWSVLVLLALAAITAYLTRICISATATTIQKEFGIDNAQMGVVLSAFFLGYLWFQVPNGWLSRRWGSRTTLAALSVLAAGCTIWGGMAHTPEMLRYSRIGLGVAQAGLVPCCSRAVVDWFPTQTRGTASAVVASSMSLGAVLASGLTAQLLPHLGWRGVFFTYAGIALAWTAAYYLWFRDHPEAHPATNAAECALIRGPRDPDAGPLNPKAAASGTMRQRFRATLTLLGTMAGSSSAWLICGQAYFRAFGQAFFLTWFPAYLEKGHGVKLQDTGMLAMLPLAANVVGGLVGGGVVDMLLRRTGSKRISRSGTATVTAFLCALCTLGAAFAPGPVAMVLVLSVASFFFGMGNPTGWAAAMDISGEHTQVVFAIQNMCGNIGAMQCATVVGRLFDHIVKTHASWNLVIYLFFGIQLGGAICWAFLNPNRSAVERDPGGHRRGAEGAE